MLGNNMKCVKLHSHTFSFSFSFFFLLILYKNIYIYINDRCCTDDCRLGRRPTWPLDPPKFKMFLTVQICFFFFFFFFLAWED